MGRKGRIALFLLVGACTRQKLPETRPLLAPASETEINQVIENALQADGRSEEYRWVSDRSYQVRVARASFVLTPAQGRRGWWLVQVHSSTAK